MECLVCHKEFKALTNTHLKRHNITPKEYEESFGCSTVPKDWCTGEKNPFYGKTHGEGSRVKSKEYGINASTRMKGKTYEELYGKETARKVKRIRSDNFSGEKNPAYVDGKRGTSYGIYPNSFDKILKNEIKQRDSFQCVICKVTTELHIHHIDYNKSNNNHINLITLCSSCHMTTNFNREYWTYFFNVLLDLRYGNPQQSLEGNFLECSETNFRSLTDNAEGNKEDTSALHLNEMMR